MFAIGTVFSPAKCSRCNQKTAQVLWLLGHANSRNNKNNKTGLGILCCVPRTSAWRQRKSCFVSQSWPNFLCDIKIMCRSPPQRFGALLQSVFKTRQMSWLLNDDHENQCNNSEPRPNLLPIRLPICSLIALEWLFRDKMEISGVFTDSYLDISGIEVVGETPHSSTPKKGMYAGYLLLQL